MKRTIFSAVGLILVGLLLTSAFTLTAWAQTTPTLGSLGGVVTDPQGASVAGASVTVRHNETRRERQVSTSDQGTFVFPLLEPGTYTVIVEASGFKKSLLPDAVVEIGKQSQLTIALEVGAVSETVTVTASGVQEMINSTSPTLTNVITPRQVVDLPLATRNPLDLAGLQPGVAASGDNTRGSSISGLRQTSTYVTQDGINSMDNFVKTSSLFAINAPSLNSTQEISITTGTTGSEVGRGVGQVNVVTKGGSNDIHGEGFYLVRSDSLEANDFFNNLAGTPRPKEHQHFFGFSMGGPVFLPKPGEGGKNYWSGRNRSFWFLAYEGFRENFAVTRNRTVLTPAARTGLFSYTGANGQTTSVNLLALGNFSALNPTTGAQINAMPAPNNTLVGDGFNTSGFRYNVTGSDPNDKVVLRFDHQLVEKSKLGAHKLEFVYNRAQFKLFPDTFNALEAPFPGGIDAGQASKRFLYTIADHMTFGNVTNEARYGRQWAPVKFLRDVPPPVPFFVVFASALGGNAGTNASGIDNSFQSQGRNTIVNQFVDNLAFSKGAHSLRFGGDFQQVYANTFNDAGITETINMNSVTSAAASNSQNPSGIVAAKFPNLPSGGTGTAIVNRASNIYADLVGLLGPASQTFNVTSPTSGFVPGATRSRIFQERDMAFYGQDQWRVKHNLTLSLGLRWEFLGVPTIPNGLSISPTNANDIFGVSGGINGLFNPNAPAGAAPPKATLNFVSGDTGIGLYKNDWNNFAPSFGFAWSPNFNSGFLHSLFGSEGTSSIRGGYSISYLHDGFTTISNALGTGTTNPGLIQTAANNTPTGVLGGSGVALTLAPFVMPVTDRQNNLLNTNNGLWTFDPNLRIPYVQQWSIGYEREMTKDMAFEVRYVGNHAIKVWRAVDFNEVNIFENGFLKEFLNAQANLAARGGTSYAPPGIGAACATCVPLPILSALFTQAGLPTGQTTAGQFSNATFINNLTNNNIGAMTNTLAFSNTYRGNRENAALGIPANFFVANPNASFARILGNDSMSNYHALQVEIRRRFAKGLQFQADYTFSKSLTDARDAYGNNQSDLVSFRTLRNKHLDYTRSNQDQTHRFVANGIYELPFGHGKKFFSGVNGMVDRVVGGFSIGSIVTWASGQPRYVASNRSTFNSYNVNPNPAAANGISFEDFKKNIGIFRTSTGVYFVNPNLLTITTSASGAFVSSTLKSGLMSAPLPGTFGNFPINSLSSPPYFDWDASLVKRIPITERVRLEIKTTAINVLNHPNFLFPNTISGVANANAIFDSSNFGRITGTRGTNTNFRIVHFTFKLNW